MKNIIIAIILLMISGCTMKITFTNITNYSGGNTDQYLSADGAVVTTETDQAADGKLDADLTGM